MAYQNPCPQGQCVSTQGNCQSVTSLSFHPHPDYECKQIAIKTANSLSGFSSFKPISDKIFGGSKGKRNKVTYFDSSNRESFTLPYSAKSVFKMASLSLLLLLSSIILLKYLKNTNKI